MNLYDNKNFPQDFENKTLTCANNCRGVDPNAVVIGGGALLAATALGSLQLLPGVVGLAGTFAMGTAAMAMLDNGCPSDMPCPVSKFRPGRSIVFFQVRGIRNPRNPRLFCCRPRGRGALGLSVQCPRAPNPSNCAIRPR